MSSFPLAFWSPLFCISADALPKGNIPTYVERFFLSPLVSRYSPTLRSFFWCLSTPVGVIRLFSYWMHRYVHQLLVRSVCCPAHSAQFGFWSCLLYSVIAAGQLSNGCHLRDGYDESMTCTVLCCGHFKHNVCVCFMWSHGNYSFILHLSFHSYFLFASHLLLWLLSCDISCLSDKACLQKGMCYMYSTYHITYTTCLMWRQNSKQYII